MTSRKSLMINCLVSSLLFGGSVWGFFMLGKGEAPERNVPPKPVGVPVMTAAVETHSGPVTIDSHGVVVPLREIRVAAEVRGRVIEQAENLRSGARVTKGEVLIRIDPTDYQLEVRRLEAQLQKDQAELAALEVSVENSTKLLELAIDEHELLLADRQRLESLEAGGAVSMSDIDGSKRAEIVTRGAVVRVENSLRDQAAQRKLLHETVKLTEIQLERARVDLARTTIVSPIDGTIVQSMVEEQSFVQAGQSFVFIEDTSSMEVRCSLTAEEMQWIWTTANSMEKPADDGSHRYAVPIPATVSFQAGDHEYQWQAEFDRVDGTGIDQRTRTTPCLFRVTSPAEVISVGARAPGGGPAALMRGMYVTVTMSCSPAGVLYNVPSRAIRPGEKIWLAEKGKLRIEQVRIVSRTANAAIVESDQLDVGSQVIVSPVAGAQEGLAVSTGDGRQGGPGRGRGNGPGAGPGPAQTAAAPTEPAVSVNTISTDKEAGRSKPGDSSTEESL